jgi:hypothetical protein
MAALTDSGDQMVFTAASGYWSRASGFEALVRPNGVRSGGAITPHADNNKISIAALEVNLNGVITSVNAGTVTLARPANAKVRISSIIVSNAGTLSSTAGADGDTFSETRAANGGPPLVATDVIEIGQVKLTDDEDAVVAVADIRQVPGTHMELYNFPLWNVDYFRGRVTFVQALPLIHTGPVAKRVYAEYATAIGGFAPVSHPNNVKVPEESYTVASEQDYDGVTASVSKTLGQGSFDAKLEDGVTDHVVQLKGQNLWFQFYPDRYKSPHIDFQGVLGVDRSFPAGGATTAACTVSAESTGIEVQ